MMKELGVPMAPAGERADAAIDRNRYFRPSADHARGPQLRAAMAKALYSGNSDPGLYRMIMQAARRDAGLS